MDDAERQWEEQGLRAAVLAGNEHAWRTLYDRHFDPLFAYVLARTRDPQRSEELVQDAWTAAVRRIGSFDPARGPFGAWMRGIVERLMLNERRRWARRHRLQESGGDIPPNSSKPDLDKVESVEQALASLPEHYRAVLCAKYEEGRSLAEIADDKGLSVKAAESLLTRARQAFRTAWVRLSSRDV
jgi:RNA polymerase sigma-70 factor (ECF subfamily)